MSNKIATTAGRPQPPGITAEPRVIGPEPVRQLEHEAVQVDQK
jgi:hypothetical protein